MDLDKILKARAKQQRQDKEIDQAFSQARTSQRTIDAVAKVETAIKNQKLDKVEITNTELAKSNDIDSLKSSVDELNLTTFMASQNWLTGLGGIVDNLSELAKDISTIHEAYDLQGKLTKAQKNSLSVFDNIAPLIERLDTTAKEIKSSKVQVDSSLASSVSDAVSKLQTTIVGMQKSINAIDWKPQFNVPASQAPDLSPLIQPLSDVKSAIQDMKFPETKFDLLPLQHSMDNVTTTLQNLKFPVPNYVHPFKNVSGESVQAPVPYLSKPFDRLTISYTDSTKNTISTIITKLNGVTQETLTNTSDATTDDFQRT